MRIVKIRIYLRRVYYTKTIIIIYMGWAGEGIAGEAAGRPTTQAASSPRPARGCRVHRHTAAGVSGEVRGKAQEKGQRARVPPQAPVQGWCGAVSSHLKVLS